jgi:hypothetical protein
MDWTSLIGPAVVAAGVSGVVSVVGFLVSARTARSIQAERLAFDKQQAERKFDVDKDLAEKKFIYDRELAERKFAQEREQLVHKRQFELAESLLADAYRFQGLIRDARMRGSFGREGTTRKSDKEESEDLKQAKDMYYIPVERLRRDGEFFAAFFAKQFSAAAQFGPKAKESFDIFKDSMNSIFIASGMLITMADRPSLDDQTVKANLLTDLWGGREDKIEPQIEKAVTTLEAICRPVLERTAS